MSAHDEVVVRAFNDAINARDLEALDRLMAEEHRFVDTAGAAVEGRRPCLEAWQGFFAAFPDYRNHFADVVSADGTVAVTGRSSCSVPELDGPARWRAVVADGLVVEWRVMGG